MNKLTRILVLLTVLACVVDAVAQSMLLHRRAPVATALPSYIIEENFEDPSVSNSWTRFGTQTWFYDTSPAPLQGTNSVMFSSAGAEAYTNITGVSSFYWHERIHITQPLSSQYHFAARSNTTAMCQLRLTSAGALQLNHNGVTAASNNGLVTSNTTYYIWGFWQKGTIGSSDSSGWVKYSTTSTKPSTNAVTISNGNSSNQVNRVVMQGWSGGTFIHDRFLVDDEDIDSNP